MTCQIPDRSGLPSRVRGVAVAPGAWAPPPAASAMGNSVATMRKDANRSHMDFLLIVPRLAKISGHQGGWNSNESQVDQRQQLSAVLAPRLAVNRGDGGDERLVLLRREIDDLPAFLPDGRHRLLFLFHMQVALERDRVANRLPKLLLQRVRPRVKRWPVQKDRPREVEVIRRAVEAMVLVHAVGDGIREWILLGIQRTGFYGVDHFRQVHDSWGGAQQLEGPYLHLAGEHANRHAFHVGGRVNRPEAIRDMTKAVFEVAENSIVHARFD